ncbi:tRNA (adenosine(37)-N6)-dimethylallyltransferase MiaA [Homoserinibacter sp. GY 40078]|uniref:tRNA (adenosine(37)-N6)-dimethylallyltransferase MiaA n=1 Tax=Homoserinibacter sp. GY 40078 TaxID=2603275 RepID=UPI0011C8E8DF|nr:tRNA (adenosine(37)-N6)-dimethylallyltransferase MiaA [Homoserinibacter sp. GY 40078]TXK19834.1 tRNA (adenosine(37)-N6)-dimethylallyltransferase MiaA [Homoserinibacter sp. GY 40078]
MTRLVAVVGATGTGKSELAVDLAERLGRVGERAEIVNADAMQLYRGMDIGTAKLTVDERRGIPHLLLDVLEPSEEASVARYQIDARAVIDDILGRGVWPILVGGSGLYVGSVIDDFRFPGTDAGIRARLEAELEAEGPGILHRRLSTLDPEAAAAIGAHNGRRIVRALEVIELTGEPFGSGLPESRSRWRPTTIVGLRLERPVLIARLDARVERMWRAGLLAEVEGLRPAGLGTTASRAIGYAQALAQLDGALDEAQAIAETQALTRRYARRQVSWFRRDPDTVWLDADDPERADGAFGAVQSAAGRLPG